MAFAIAYNQNEHLLGKNGLLPANKYMERVFGQVKSAIRPNKKLTPEFNLKYNLFMNCPTLFWLFDWANNIDSLLNNSALIGKINCVVYLHLLRIVMQKI